MSASDQGSLKRLLLGALGPTNVGRLEYVLRPSLRKSWGGPMNGQAGRRQIFTDIVAAVRPGAIIETGTFRGTTTEFLATFGVPVYSVESQPRYYVFADLRLRSLRPLVKVSLGDSRAFLSQLARDASVPKQSVVFYLDAHWSEDLPLAEELTTIFGAWSRSVVMIDDFAVPGDSYGYDDYGPGRALDADYLAALARRDLSVFYPALRAYKETGAKRGCVVLCTDPGTSTTLAGLDTLRRA